jgi:hypothetical protein
MPKYHDVVIVGAGKLSNSILKAFVNIVLTGLYGIAAARAYLELHPNESLQIFESESTLGGVWSSSK